MAGHVLKLLGTKDNGSFTQMLLMNRRPRLVVLAERLLMIQALWLRGLALLLQRSNALEGYYHVRTGTGWHCALVQFFCR